MKHVLICRHAKTKKIGPGEADRDRELTKRGKADARAVAEELSRRGFHPEIVLASDSTRTRETAKIMLRHLSGRPETFYLRELYSATAGGILDVVTTYGLDADTVLVIGHNPGMEELVSRFSGEMTHLKTSAVAVLSVDEDQALTDYPLTGLVLDEVITADSRTG